MLPHSPSGLGGSQRPNRASLPYCVGLHGFQPKLVETFQTVSEGVFSETLTCQEVRLSSPVFLCTALWSLLLLDNQFSDM